MCVLPACSVVKRRGEHENYNCKYSFDEKEKEILEAVTEKLCERAKEMADKIGGDGEY